MFYRRLIFLDCIIKTTLLLISHTQVVMGISIIRFKLYRCLVFLDSIIKVTLLLISHPRL